MLSYWYNKNHGVFSDRQHLYKRGNMVVRNWIQNFMRSDYCRFISRVLSSLTFIQKILTGTVWIFFMGKLFCFQFSLNFDELKNSQTSTVQQHFKLKWVCRLKSYRSALRSLWSAGRFYFKFNCVGKVNRSSLQLEFYFMVNCWKLIKNEFSIHCVKWTIIFKKEKFEVKLTKLILSLIIEKNELPKK